jgi:hypothetical protein
MKPSSSAGETLLDGLALDLLVGVMAQSTPRVTIDVLEAGAVTCGGFGNITNLTITPAQAAACTNNPSALAISDVVLSYSNRSVDWKIIDPLVENVAGLPPTLAESIPNYLRAASEVILMDIGIWSNNSILVSPAAFNVSITPNGAISNILQHQSFFPGFWQLPFSQASAMRTDPTYGIFVPEESRNPAVIAMSYLCHEHRRKNAFSLIICRSCNVHTLNLAFLMTASCCCGGCIHVLGLLGHIYGFSGIFCLPER